MGENLLNALYNTVIGMGTVFLVLIFISFIIWLFKFINKAGQKKTSATVDENQVVTAPETIKEESDDCELVAVIAGAIAAYEGTSADSFVVRSIRRRK